MAEENQIENEQALALLLLVFIPFVGWLLNAIIKMVVVLMTYNHPRFQKIRSLTPALSA